jgi:hypothetical protein
MASILSTVSPSSKDHKQDHHEDTISKLASVVSNKLTNVTHTILNVSPTTKGEEITTHPTTSVHSVVDPKSVGPSVNLTSATKNVIDVVNKTLHSLTTASPIVVPHNDDVVTATHSRDDILSSNSSMILQNDTHSQSTHGFPYEKGTNEHDHHLSFLAHSFMFQALMILAFVVALFAVIYVLRKKHLDRLRHHLMPIYNFDPSDDGEDWETELLDDQMVHMPNNDPNPSLNGQLKLDTGLTRGLRIHNNNSNGGESTGKTTSGLGSPTAASGLLSSSSDSHASQSRRLYTNERNPIA